ncbi:MAG: S-adenosylmethionine:tRNA ribosyltransferase-isomerase [Bacteroidetes bacterium]|nr:S-adenosylmethionine:tRNA ribosyltransferase-isomerase [Bacteroidota bacterium]
MFDPGDIRIKDYDYNLPAGQIAQFPLAERDASKLLIYRQRVASTTVFSEIGRHLPANSLLVFNNTRVIRARLIFRKPTGGQIEIFCLEPLAPVCEIQAAFHQQTQSTWKCLVGNLKRWKSGTLLLECMQNGLSHQLFAERAGDCGDGSYEIVFRWDPPEKTFSEILEIMGVIPLPPYIDRVAEPSDSDRYQTIYAAHEGSVAAPTAGLHFTTRLLARLLRQGIKFENVTLHVGVGTFRPVGVEQIRDHVMHHEKIVVSKHTIQQLYFNLSRPVIAVGTTSARTLESLYWIGVNLILEGSGLHPGVSQWAPYQHKETGNITTRQSLEALLGYLEAKQLDEYSGETMLMIVPGYRFKVISGLITNFHMPQSTLLLLVAAMIGADWRNIYEYARQNGFRFLSYGDSCLFFNPEIILP